MALHGAAMLLNQGGYSGYQIDQSVLLDGSSDYFNITFAGDDGDTWTFSAWFKLDLVNDFSGIFGQAGRNVGLTWDNYNIKANDGSVTRTTTRVFRDPGSWVHVYASNDGTRGRVFINGVEENSFNGAFNWTYINTAYNHYFCRNNLWGRLRGYCAEMHFCSLNEYEPTEFGEFYNGTTAWRPIEPSGLTYGNNGFYLDFSNPANLGKDISGNGNNLTVNGSPVQSSDSPTKNYATLNPLQYRTTATLSLGNTKKDNNGSSSNQNAGSTIAVSSGKWYVEAQATGGAGSNFCFVDINEVHTLFTTNVNLINTPNNSILWADNIDDLRITDNGSLTTHAAELTAGNPGLNTPIGIVLNLDDDEVRLIDANGITSTARSIPSGITWQFAVGGSNSDDQQVFFREEDWTHTPPADYQAIAAANLPEVTITDPGEYFNAVAYIGDGTAIGSGGNSITGVGFQPDFTWIKNRDGTNTHQIYDVLRGAQKVIHANTTSAESTESEGLNSFDSDGFTVGSNGGENTNTNNYISWNWKAGGAGVVNTDGTTTATVSANDDAGFSIATWASPLSAATIGHGLSAAPELIIAREYDDVMNWQVYHKDVGNGHVLLLNSAAAKSATLVWNSTDPTSSVFSVSNRFNTAGNYLAYCFRSIPGYSKVFSYIGNGSTDGPFVHLGFKPRWVIYKRSDSTGAWEVFDTERSKYNLVDDKLFADQTTAETVANGIDILSNGFKFRSSGASRNASGGTYIGIAFAENPFGGSNLPLGLAQ